MSINISLSNSQFFDVFKKSEFLAGMSYNGVCEVLDYIEECTEADEIVDWTAWFMDVGEYDEVELISNFSDFGYLIDVDSETESILEDVIEAVRMQHIVRVFETNELISETKYIVI